MWMIERSGLSSWSLRRADRTACHWVMSAAGNRDESTPHVRSAPIAAMMVQRREGATTGLAHACSPAPTSESRSCETASPVAPNAVLSARDHKSGAKRGSCQHGSTAPLRQKWGEKKVGRGFIDCVALALGPSQQAAQYCWLFED